MVACHHVSSLGFAVIDLALLGLGSRRRGLVLRAGVVFEMLGRASLWDLNDQGSRPFIHWVGV